MVQPPADQPKKKKKKKKKSYEGPRDRTGGKKSEGKGNKVGQKEREKSHPN